VTGMEAGYVQAGPVRLQYLAHGRGAEVRIEVGGSSPGYPGQPAQRRLTCRVWLERAPAAVEAGEGASWRYEAPFAWVDLPARPPGEAVSIVIR
jgi:hypothetical protein